MLRRHVVLECRQGHQDLLLTDGASPVVIDAPVVVGIRHPVVGKQVAAETGVIDEAQAALRVGQTLE